MKVFERIKSFTWVIVRAVQRVLITVLLFFTYYLGMGILFLLAMVFKRSLVTDRSAQVDSNWVPATGYDLDENRLGRQS